MKRCKRSITLDKKTYQAGDAAKAKVTLKNAGTVPLTGLYAACDPAGAANALEVQPSRWGAFSPLTQAGELTPGQSVVLDVVGKVPAKAPYLGSTHLHCLFEGRTHLSGPGASGEAKAPGMSGDSRGQLWQDKNGNYRPDPGEGLANTTVTLTREGDKRLVSLARTGAGGFATFSNVAMGEYVIHVTGPWKVAEHPMVFHYAPPHDSAGDSGSYRADPLNDTTAPARFAPGPLPHKDFRYPWTNFAARPSPTEVDFPLSSIGDTFEFLKQM